MASQLIREWSGIQQFPPATQTKLHELLGKLKQENVNTLTILVMGKGGVGKSSTVKSIIGERAVSINAFQSEGPRPVMVSRTRAGFTLNIIDTPGLVEGGYVNDQALEIIKRFLLNKTIDILLYVDRLDAYRVDNLDRQIVRAITDSFGQEIWHRGLVVLTHAQLSPPDGLSYEDFFSRRSEALLKVVRLGARIKKQDVQGSSIPVVLVENSGRCNKNENDEKMNSRTLRRLELDWYSPTHLLSSPVKYDFLGDRFIPNRSLMDLDKAHTLLTSMTKLSPTSQFSDAYRLELEKNLTLDSEGRPFRMLVFRGSPKSSRRLIRHIDEMLRGDEDNINYTNNVRQNRKFPKKETRILDAPGLKDDYYLSVMDWGKTNIVAVALGPVLYLWNAENTNIQQLPPAKHVEDDHPSSVAWSNDAKTIAVGHLCSEIQLWDAESLKLLRRIKGHREKVGTLLWNGHILTSGGRDKAIINHDVRVKNNIISIVKAHKGEVCGLKWSSRGNLLASGDSDSRVFIWDAAKMSSSHLLHQFNDHNGAVKALAWSPHDSDILASGGGMEDGFIKMWNTQKGLCINSIDTKAQVCGLEWNRHHKEIVSGHGYSVNENKNMLRLWSYPSMSRVAELRGHKYRVLHLSQSPDGLTLASAGADETLRLWDIFGPPRSDKSRVSVLDDMLSLKTSLIR